MLFRRFLWGVVSAMGVLLLLGSGALAWSLLARSEARPIGLVVFGGDARLRLLNDGEEAQRVLAEDASDEQFRFPAISPSGRYLAYVAGAEENLRIVRIDLVTGERRELYSTVVNQPFSLAWSPDSAHISFLLVSSAGLTTHIVRADGSEPARLIASSESSYIAWTPDGSTMLLHLDGHTVQGGRLDTYTPGHEQSEPLLSDPGFFQAPAWAADGRSIYYVAQPPITSERPTLDDLESQIVRTSRDGRDVQVLVNEKFADLRIVRAPTSDEVAYVAAQPLREGIVAGQLKVIDGNGGAPRTLSREDEQVTAFFWSPDGAQIAYIASRGDGAGGRRSWQTVDIVSGAVRDLGEFTPSAALVGLERFFDAYLFAFSPWAPDGSRLAYGADDGVYVLDLTDGRARRVSDGTLALWVGGR